MKQKTLLSIIGVLTAVAGTTIVSANAGDWLSEPGKTEDVALYATAKDSVPAAPTMAVTPDATGANSVKVRIVLPTKDKSGNAVTKVTSVKLYRANVLIKEFDTSDGKSVNYYDTVPKTNMNYSYAASAVNVYGEGAKVTKSGYVGVKKPTAIAEVRIQVMKDRNKVRVSWDAPTLDTQKRPIDPSKLTYTVKMKDSSSSAVILKEGLKETYFDYEYTGTETKLVNFLVASKNEVGLSVDKYSLRKVFLGAPYKLPYKESYSGGVPQTYTITQSGATGASGFKCYKDGEFESICASDNDNGHFVVQLPDYGRIGEMITNYVDLQGATRPYLFIDLYKYNNERTHTYEIIALRDSVETSLKKGEFPQLPLEGWNPVGVDLKSVAGDPCQFIIRVSCGKYGYAHIDNIRIMDAPNCDIMVSDIKVPDYVNEGMESKITAQLTNHGISKSKDIELRLLRDGNVVKTMKCPAIEGMKSMFFTMTDAVSAGAGAKECTYSIVAVCDGDSNTDNNSTEVKKTTVLSSSLPKISNLAGESGSKISLTWNAPDLSRMPLPAKMENFEAYEPLADIAGEWTTIDGDGEEISGFSINNIKLPVTGKHGFFIMDNTMYPGSFDSEFLQSHDKGKRYAVSMYINKRNVLADDWLISPELNGCEQMISYMCGAYFNFPLVWEVYYSKTGKEPKDFIKLDSLSYNSRWKKYMHLVPEGTKYFAIHSCHDGPVGGMASCMPMIDDITYIPAGKADGKLLGYNVYCDDKLITAKPVTECRYEGEKPDAGKHVYKVTAVYDRGESSPLKLEMTVGVGSVVVESEIVEKVWYDMTGIRVPEPEKGDGRIYILKTIYAGGKVVTKKVLNK